MKKEEREKEREREQIVKDKEMKHKGADKERQCET